MVAPSRRIAADRDAENPLAPEHLAATQMLAGLIGRKDGGARVPVVQVVGLQGGEGVTTLTRSLARSVRAGMGVGVQHVSFSEGFGGPEVRRGEAGGGDDRLGDGIQHVVLPVGAIPRILADGLEGETGARPGTVRLVLVETPPLLSSVEGAAMSGQVDGTIIVAGADSSTYTAARAGRDVVERAGGRVLGIVLNKRRYRVPGTVARVLGIPGSRTGGLRRAVLVLLVLLGLVAGFLYLSGDAAEEAGAGGGTAAPPPSAIPDGGAPAAPGGPGDGGDG